MKIANAPREPTTPISPWIFLWIVAVFAIIPVYFFNHEIFFWLNCRGMNEVLKNFFLLMTSLADGALIFSLVILVSLQFRKSLSAFVIAAIFSNVVLHSLKIIVSAKRPLAFFETGKVCVLGFPVTVNSFPSGHSLSAILLFMYLRNFTHGWTKISIFVFCLLAAISRAVVGAHFPIDILAGALMGVTIYWLVECYLADHFSKLQLSRAGVLFKVLVGVFATVFFIFFYTERNIQMDSVTLPLAVLLLSYFLFRGGVWIRTISFHKNGEPHD